jgi:NAD(P)-dependent dehydrogenase (short-subunit alcohol dehydrogenase family)
MAKTYHEAQNRDQQKKTVLVTGATGAIGKAIARQLAAQGFAVILAARNEQKAHDALQEIRLATGNEDVYYELVDLSRKASIQALAGRWPGKLDVLVNNAGTTPRNRLETPEGIEVQWATNVLGYFWMMQAFQEKLKEAAPARVINVASYWAGGLDLSDPEFKQRRYDNGTAYRQSKQADRMLTAAFAERFAPIQVTVNSCHPGDVNSQLSNDLGFGGSESADSGARTPVWLATDPVGGRETGKYFEHMHESRDRFMADKSAVEALYELCLNY